MSISNDDALFLSKLDDAVYLSQKRGKAYFLSFLSERRQALAQAHFKSEGFEDYAFFGGYEGAERKVLGIFPYEPEEFPVDALEFKFRKVDKLTHRDFLGALMSLGIERETVGDILVEDGRCVVFVKSEISGYITSQVFKIGNAGVTVGTADPQTIPKGRGFDEKDYTVSSLRLDAVIAAVTGLSREKTKSLILSGSVSRNYECCQNISKTLSVQDTFTVRGKGKYILSGVIGETKKHRLRISIIHFR